MGYWGTALLEGDAPGDILGLFAEELIGVLEDREQNYDTFASALALFCQGSTFDDYLEEELIEHDNYKKFRQRLLELPEQKLLIDCVEGDQELALIALEEKYGQRGEDYMNCLGRKKRYFNKNWLVGAAGISLLKRLEDECIQVVDRELAKPTDSNFAPDWLFVGYLAQLMLLPRTQRIGVLANNWLKAVKELPHSGTQFETEYLANLITLLNIAKEEQTVFASL